MAGRPRKEIDQRQFEGLCGLQCTVEEMCGWFGVSPKTLYSWVKRTYGENFSTIFSQKRERGKISLRRSQWRLAEKNASSAVIEKSQNNTTISKAGASLQMFPPCVLFLFCLILFLSCFPLGKLPLSFLISKSNTYPLGTLISVGTGKQTWNQLKTVSSFDGLLLYLY